MIDPAAPVPGTQLCLGCEEPLPPKLHDSLNAAREYAAQEKSAATRRAYRSDFRLFAGWCSARGLEPMQATAAIVGAFLADEAGRGVKASTISRRAAAIRYAFALAGLEPPTNQEAFKAVTRGIRRSIGTAQAQKAAATADRVRAMLDLTPDTLIGIRDRALIALGFAMAARRSELVALDVEDLTEVPDGLRVRVRRSKTDQEGEGAEIAVPRGARLRPVEAVQTWLRAAGITEGPIFRSVWKGGRVSQNRLRAEAVALIVKSYAERAGLNPDLFAGHSLRAGFLTSAAESGATVFKMMEVSRHKSVDTLRGYVRRADAFREHAGASFL